MEFLLPILEILTLGPIGTGGRVPFPIDPVAQAVIERRFAPNEGGSFGGQTWTKKTAGADGWFDGLRGYSFARVERTVDQVMVLEAAGHSMAYVNGAPVMGDPYGYGYVRAPVLLKKGQNDLIFANGRGRLKVALRATEADAELALGDPTLPDLIVGQTQRLWGAVVVLNNTTKPMRGLEITAQIGSGRRTTRLAALPPLTFQKVPFEIPAEPGSGPLKLELKQGGTALDQGELPIRTRKPTESHRITFRSQIDDSLQYFAVVPPKDLNARKLILSLHGASVEAQGQAEAYSSQPDAWIVCPTNRRPFGFDWEDWGRMDALEVLAEAKKRYRIDSDQVHLTGHSMGGHGTWSLGSLFPDLFASIAPSAGWRSFFTYTGTPRPRETSLQTLFADLTALSNPEQHLSNYKRLNIYVLHGDADDNVPVSEARAMRENLRKIGLEPGYHEQPGAGHWWDGERAVGADCLEWPELFATFQKPRQPRDPGEFVTHNPAVTGSWGPVTILAQERRFQPSRISLQMGQVTTENVRSVTVRAGVRTLDGQPVQPGEYVREGTWKRVSKAPRDQGPLKEMFQNRFALVYGTQGTPEENAQSYAMARYHAQQFYYRGNGAPALLADTEIGKKERRNLVVYGSAKTNRVWRDRLGEDPNAPNVFWRATPSGVVVAFGGRTLAECRALERLPIFVSGVAYPDYVRTTAQLNEKGFGAVLEAGFNKR